MEAEGIRQHNFTITYDELLDERYGITPPIKNILQKSYFDIVDHKVGSINKLKAYIEQYPRIPQFKNQLSVAYRESGNMLLAHQVNKILIKEHPEYLFGMLNEVNQFISVGETEKAAKLMEGYDSVQDWDTDRKVFHVSEFSSFEVTLINLLIAQGKIDVAESRLPMLKDVDDPHMYLMAKNLVDDYKREQAEEFDAFMEENLGKRWPQTDLPPTFHHQEIKELYQYNLTIDQAILQNILKLPRETLVQDLRAMLHDSLVRLEYFMEKAESNEAPWFPYHALALLAELQASEALPEVLDMLRADEEWSDFWFGDAISEDVPKLIVEILRCNAEPLHQYLKEPDNYTYLREVASQTLLWMVRKDKNLYKQIISIYQDLFLFYLEHENDMAVTDPELIAYLICDVMEIDARTLEQDMKPLFENDLVAEWITGDWKTVKEDLKLPIRPLTYTKLSLVALYDEWIETYHQPNSHTKKQNTDTDWDFSPLQEQMAQLKYDDYFDDIDDKPMPAMSTKVGRNEPCPCGSGKKYKKCCGE